MRAEVDDLVAGGAQAREELLLQAEPAVIRRDAHAHVRSFMSVTARQPPAVD